MTRYNINLDRCDNDVTLFMELYTKRVVKKMQTNSERVLKIPADTKFRPTKALLYFDEIKILRHFSKIKTIITLPRPQQEYSESHVTCDIIFLTD